MTSNTALTDELEAVNSIYNVDTLTLTVATDQFTSTILTLPTSPFSFNVTFPCAYPDVPPEINGTQSTGPHTKKGEGETALNILRDVLGNIYIPGQVCLFDLIEEVTPLLLKSDHDIDSHDTNTSNRAEEGKEGNNGASQDHGPAPSRRSAPTLAPSPDISNLHIKDPTSDLVPASTLPEPNWSLSQALLVSKSSFIARAVQAHSLHDATSAISHLLSTNKKVAAATHNVTAWRIKTPSTGGNGSEITIQDCDDDGETAAGGRLLHLMQLMDVWNVVVIVTRWYGGAKLGADRFRCINMVARDALVKGGFAKEEPSSTNSKGKGKKK